MVQFKRSIVLSTCFLSGAASVISFVSLFTQGWVYFDGLYNGQNQRNSLSTFNYGLFGGTFHDNYITFTTVDISMTCSYSNNVCAVLCDKSSESERELLDKLYHGNEIEWSIQNCAQLTSLTEIMLEKTPGRLARLFNESADQRVFINAFAYLFTIIFLIISCLLGLICAGLSVWNTAANPVEVYFNIFGLYLYNGIAFGSLLISMMIWGIMFCSTLVDHPSYMETITGVFIAHSVSLGWSYWINVASLLLYASSIGVLYLRSYLLSKEPQLKGEIEDDEPPGIILF